jgi:anti-sigma factor RsiW
MNSHVSQESISEWLDGQLSGEDEARIAEHVRTCDECRSIHAEMAAITKLFKEAEPLRPPAGLWTRIANELDAPGAERVAPLHPLVGTTPPSRAYSLPFWLQARAWIPATALLVTLTIGGSVTVMQYRSHSRLRALEFAEIDHVQNSLLASNLESSNPFRSSAVPDTNHNPFSQRELQSASNPFRSPVEGGKTESRP